jgi:hypothetical protein
MKKIKGIVTKIEGSQAFLKSNSSELIIPKDLIKGKVGDSIVITFSDETEDLENSKEVAKELLSQALRGE